MLPGHRDFAHGVRRGPEKAQCPMQQRSLLQSTRSEAFLFELCRHTSQITGDSPIPSQAELEDEPSDVNKAILPVAASVSLQVRSSTALLWTIEALHEIQKGVPLSHARPLVSENRLPDQLSGNIMLTVSMKL